MICCCTYSVYPDRLINVQKVCQKIMIWKKSIKLARFIPKMAIPCVTGCQLYVLFVAHVLIVYFDWWNIEHLRQIPNNASVKWASRHRLWTNTWETIGNILVNVHSISLTKFLCSLKQATSMYIHWAVQGKLSPYLLFMLLSASGANTTGASTSVVNSTSELHLLLSYKTGFIFGK